MAMAMAILTDSSALFSCFHACCLPSLSSSHNPFPTRNGFVSVIRRGSQHLKKRTLYGENLVSNSSCYWNGAAKGGEEAILEKGMRRQRKLEFDTVHASDNAALHRKAKRKKAVRSTEPCCYGCGAPLQTSDANSPGYVPMDRFLLKKKHHQLKALLCARCCLLTQGKMIPAVGGNGGYGGKRFILAEQLREQLSHLRDEKALIIKLVDIVDFNGSFLTRIRDLVGANPIILVATKADLLPKGTDLKAVGDWLIECTLRKKLSVLSVHLISSKSLMGISGVVSDMQQCRQGRNVYILVCLPSILFKDQPMLENRLLWVHCLRLCLKGSQLL